MATEQNAVQFGEPDVRGLACPNRHIPNSLNDIVCISECFDRVDDLSFPIHLKRERDNAPMDELVAPLAEKKPILKNRSAAEAVGEYVVSIQHSICGFAEGIAAGIPNIGK